MQSAAGRDLDDGHVLGHIEQPHAVAAIVPRYSLALQAARRISLRLKRAHQP